MRIKLIRAIRKPPWFKLWSAITGVALVVALVLTFLPYQVNINTDGLLSISLQQTQANPDWYSTYSYRKALNITGQAGAGTNYQILLKVGESSGTTGEDFDVTSHCSDFPYDIAFTDNDGAAALNFTSPITITGVSPNRLAIFRVNVVDSLESGTVPIYCYYGKALHTPTGSATATFNVYGKLGAQNYEAIADTGEESTEHAIVYGGYLYISACDFTNKNGGVKKYSMDGALVATYAATTYTQCTPVLASSGGDGNCLFLYDVLNSRLNRVRLSDNSITHYATTGATDLGNDIESMGWDTVNNRLILPVYISGSRYLRAYNMADLSVNWSYSITFDLGSCASPLVLGNYVYWNNCEDGVLYKLNLSDGTLADSVDLGSGTGAGWSYASPIYDPDNEYIYCISTFNKIHAVDPSDMSEVWSHTFAAGSGSDSDYVTYTGMTTPGMKNGLMYHNGKVIIYQREHNVDADHSFAKVYGLIATTGIKAWSNTSLYNDGQDANSSLLTDDHIILGGLDYAYPTTNYHVGSFYVLNQSDGTLVYKGALPWGCFCAAATQAYDGRCIFAMTNGLWATVKLGWGSTDDSPHWMKNAYHNGYCGDKLTVDTSLTFSTRSATITDWTEDGGTSIDAEGFGMRLAEHENQYAHVEKTASALTNFAAEIRVYATSQYIGGSWMPAVFAYWGIDDWAGVGLTYSSGYKFGYQYNKASTVGANYAVGAAAIRTWYWLRLRMDASNVYFDYSTDYINWTNLTSTARAASWAGAPSLIIVGKGYSDNPSYPNANLDNDYATAGTESTMHFLDVWQRKYAATEPAFSAAGSEEGFTIEITNTPDNYGFGILAVGTNSSTTINYFQIHNTGGCAVDVTIQGTDLTGGDDTWTLSDTAMPGENIYGLKAGLSGTLENFTTYIEVDPNSHIGLVDTNHIDFDAYANEDAYLYKDFGVDHFGSNWEHKVDVKPVSYSAVGSHGAIDLLSNDIDDWQGLYDASKTFINLKIERAATTTIQLNEGYLGTYYAAFYQVNLNTWYYLTVNKTGTALTCKIYSDSARTTLLHTLSLILHGDWKFRYNFAVDTINDGTNEHFDMDIENLDLQEYGTIVRRNSPYNNLAENMLEDATLDWGLQLIMPTSVSDYDSQEMTGTITLVASASS